MCKDVKRGASPNGSGRPRLHSGGGVRPSDCLSSRRVGNISSLFRMRERRISASGSHALELVPVHTSYQRVSLSWSSKPLHAINMFAVSAQCHMPSFASPHSGSQISPSEGEGEGEGERQYDQAHEDARS